MLRSTDITMISCRTVSAKCWTRNVSGVSSTNSRDISASLVRSLSRITWNRDFHGNVSSDPGRYRNSACQVSLRRNSSFTHHDRSQLHRNSNFHQRRTFADKISSLSLQSKKRKGQKITVVTAYDYPSGLHAARAGIDILLVGDSCAMVELGHETTQPVTVDELVHHCRAVKRGVDTASTQVKTTPLLLGDMPYGSYEYDDTDIALNNAYRFIKEAGMDGVKLEVRWITCGCEWHTRFSAHRLTPNPRTILSRSFETT